MARGRGIITHFKQARSLRSKADEVARDWNRLIASGQVTQPAKTGIEEDLTPQAAELITRLEALGQEIHEASVNNILDERNNKLDLINKLADQRLNIRAEMGMANLLNQDSVNLTAEEDQINDLIELAKDELFIIEQNLAGPLSKKYLKALSQIRPFGKSLLLREDQTKLAQPSANQFPRQWIPEQSLTVQSSSLDKNTLGLYLANEITINKEAQHPRAVMAHELAHFINDHNPNLRLLWWAYLQSRQEYIGGGFLDPYALRIYANHRSGAAPETEIGALAAAGLSGDDPLGWRSWWQDEEYRNFYLGALASI